MEEAPAPPRSDNGTPTKARPAAIDARKEELARALYQKVAQGFEIESQGETDAVLAMKGRRKWFGLAHTPTVRYEVTVDEDGQAASRRV